MSFYNKLKKQGIAKEKKIDIDDLSYLPSPSIVNTQFLLFLVNKIISNPYIGGCLFLTRMREEVKADIIYNRESNRVIYNEIILYK